MFTHYYGGYLRKIVVAFGTLFNNVYITHPEDGTDKTIRVPLTYAPKEKFVRRWLEESSISDTTKVGIRLPQMSFVLSRIAIDPSRRRNKVNSDVYTDDSNNLKQMFVEVPININIDLYFYTRHINDTLQIAEQIIPYFNPEFNLKVNFSDNIRENITVPLVMMNGLNLNERYDGDFSGRRLNMSSIGFVAKTYMFGPVVGDLTKLQTFDIDLETD